MYFRETVENNKIFNLLSCRSRYSRLSQFVSLAEEQYVNVLQISRHLRSTHVPVKLPANNSLIIQVRREVPLNLTHGVQEVNL